MIDPQTFATWMGKLADRWNRPLLPPTSQAYYAQLSPLLSTEEFERAAGAVFRDEMYPWPAPRVFVEKVRSNAPATYRALPAGAANRNIWPEWLPVFEKGSEREAECGCGFMYTQYALSIPFLDELAEGPRQAMLREFPDGRCPTECPRCARKILATGISYPDTPRDRERPGAEWAA